MKKFILAFLLLPLLTFAYSLEVDDNLNKAWRLYNEKNPKEAADFLTVLIEKDDTTALERLHYLNARSLFYAASGMGEECKKDLDEIRKMCLSMPECDMEMWKYYEHSFVYSYANNVPHQ